MFEVTFRFDFLSLFSHLRPPIPHGREMIGINPQTWVHTWSGDETISYVTAAGALQVSCLSVYQFFKRISAPGALKIKQKHSCTTP